MSEPEILQYVRMALALGFVLGLIALLAWGLRRWSGAALAGRRAGAARRLQVAETLALDARHRLVLVRRDETEHLLLMGAGGAIVVERGIADAAITETGETGMAVNPSATIAEQSGVSPS